MSKNYEQRKVRRKAIDDKAQVKIVAKAFDKMVEDLVSVQPMDAAAGKIFSIKPKYSNEVDPPWETWHRKIVIWPRRSITGKLVFGTVHRSSRDEFEVPFGVYLGDNEPKRFHRYATDKELFLAKLEGEA